MSRARRVVKGIEEGIEAASESKVGKTIRRAVRGEEPKRTPSNLAVEKPKAPKAEKSLAVPGKQKASAPAEKPKVEKPKQRSFSVNATQKAEEEARKKAARAAKTKYTPVDPHPAPHPELADFEFPQGAGLGGAHAIEHGVPIVGIKPFLAQSDKGYSGLSASTPANRVQADITQSPLAARVIQTPEEVAKRFSSAIPLTGDKLIVGQINSVNGRPQVGSAVAEGGPDHPRNRLQQGSPEAWASIGSVVSDLDNRREMGENLYGGPVAGVYTTMGSTALDQTTAMMDLLGRQLAAGGVTKANLKVLDKRVKDIMGEDFSKGFIGFEKDPIAAAAQLNDISRVQMPKRTAIIQGLDSANAMAAGFPDIGANRVAATVPDLLYAPEGASGYMISGLSGAKNAVGGNAPDIRHSNYPRRLDGEYFGGLEHSIPRELMWRNYAKVMQGSGYDPVQVHSYLFTRTPKEIKEAFGSDPRIQPLDQEWVDDVSTYLEKISKYGFVPYAQGGLAVKRRPKSPSGFQARPARNPSKGASKERRAGRTR